MDKTTELKSLYTAGRISRRGFMEGALALGMTVAAATAFTSEADAAKPKRGGHMRVGQGHGSTTDSMDPAVFENGFATLMGFAIHGYLTEIDSNGKLAPSLAESWDADASAKKWTFKLRDAEFHNGKPITANDVIASLEHHRGEDSKSGAKPLLSAITKINAADKKTVEIELEGGNADFPFVLTDYHLAIGKADGDKVNWLDAGNHSGGYVMQHYEPGVRAEYERANNFWADDRAFLDSGEQLTIADVAARVSAITTGEVDVIDRPDLKTLRLLKRRKNLRVDETTGTQHYTFPMLTDQKPFDDNNVRLALKYAVDRQALVDKVLYGYGLVANDSPIAPANRYFDGSIEQKSYDPDKAKFYAKKSGVDNITVTLSSADAAFSGAVDAAVLYAEAAKKAGITINVDRVPNDGYWSNVWLKKPWCACYWGGRPTEDQMFSTAYATGVPWNDSHWTNKRFDELLLQGRTELDDKKRAAIYSEMQQIVSYEGGVVIPMFANYVWVRDKSVMHHKTMAANWPLDGGRAMERWWRA